MELSSARNRDILKSNRFSMFVNASENSNLKRDDILDNENAKKNKSTPRKCKTTYNIVNEAKMKKSSSLHNIEKVGELNQKELKMSNTNPMSIVRNVSSLEKQIYSNNEFMSRIEKEKKYEGHISELSLKKEKEILLMENKRLTETVQNLQMDADKMRVLISRLKAKMHEGGQELDEEETTANEVLDASGDGGTGRSYTSLTHATVGDTNSVSSDEWQATEENCSADRDFLKSLSVSTLQDRIQKMEEDSYCTEEELQATMQELKDLQHNLDIINDDNRNLSFERAILLESLCEQTQKLQKCRLLSENLKILLLSNNSRDYPHLDVKLRESYAMSELENRTLMEQNDELKLALTNCQSESLQLRQEYNLLIKKNDEDQINFLQLKEKYQDELLQRKQVETALKSHSELFSKTIGWTDYINGVLALIQQSKGQKQVEANLKSELSEKNCVVENLMGQIRSLEENMRLGMKHKEEHKGSIEHLQTQLQECEREIYMLSQTLDILTDKFAEDTLSWRSYEFDLLTSIAAANSIKEDRDADLLEMEKRLDKSEHARKELQETLESQKNSISNQNKDRVLTNRDQNSISNTNSVKTLIESLEHQMKPGTVSIKPNPTSIRPSHNNGTHTVPRSSVSVKIVKKEITRTNTVKADISPTKHIPEIMLQKSSSFKTENPLKQPVQCTESQQTMLQPLTTVVSQASSILQTVSRRNSVVTNPITDHNVNFPTPLPSKPSNPPPNSSDPLAQLVKDTNKGSKRNALLFWCQTRTKGYQKIDITNFSSSWNDGLALCALLHSFDQNLVDYKKLADATPLNPDKSQKRINFKAAFAAAETIGIPGILDIETMINVERPSWNYVMNYVIEIYIHLECPSQSEPWGPPLT